MCVKYPQKFKILIALCSYQWLFLGLKRYPLQVQPWKMGKKFDDLSESMQNYYNNSANLKRVVAIEGSQYCALKHSDDVWYR